MFDHFEAFKIILVLLFLKPVRKLAYNSEPFNVLPLECKAQIQFLALLLSTDCPIVTQCLRVVERC